VRAVAVAGMRADGPVGRVADVTCAREVGEPGEYVNVVPATKSIWCDIDYVLGHGGSVKGCWCMFFRQTPAERRCDWGEGNRAALRALLDVGQQPGLVAYRDGSPAGWCSIAPRGEYGRLARSTVTRQVDETSVWSLVCLYV